MLSLVSKTNRSVSEAKCHSARFAWICILELKEVGISLAAALAEAVMVMLTVMHHDLPMWGSNQHHHHRIPGKGVLHKKSPSESELVETGSQKELRSQSASWR